MAAEALRCVVILGAGASAPFGVPTLRNLFLDGRARLHLKTDDLLRKGLEQIFWEPRGLSLATSAAGPTVEDMLTVLRDSEKQKYGLPVLLDGQVDEFRKRLYLLIKKAVFDGRDSRTKHLNPLLQLFSRPGVGEVTWASFNWDCLFESSFYYNSGSPGPYGGRHNPQVTVSLVNWTSYSSNHTFLKLHGGVNWWYEEEKIHYLPFGNSTELSNKWAEYENGTSKGHPVLLEPSYYKYEDALFDLVKPQWQSFIERLSRADCVVVVGYSLPEADANARSAILLGFQANPKARWFVIDKDESTCGRYHRLLGSKVLMCFQSSLEDANPSLDELIAKHFQGLQLPSAAPTLTAGITEESKPVEVENDQRT